VCPWNERFARLGEEPAYRADADLDGPALTELAARLLNMDQARFRAEFGDSPVARARRAGMLRNVCVALGNWGAEEAFPVLDLAVADADPLVRAHAAWALGEVGTAAALRTLTDRLEAELDAEVRTELSDALSRASTA
jgi:epoxyqueuosine reductase